MLFSVEEDYLKWQKNRVVSSVETFSKSDFRVVKIEECVAVPKSKKLLQFTLNDGTDRKRTILSGIHEYYEPEELVGKTCVTIVNLPPRKKMGIFEIITKHDEELLSVNISGS